MPAFGAALTADEIALTIDYVKSFCREPAWPHGELNLPRALVTEKAFPEDEAVLTITLAAGDAAAVVNEFLYERRFGARNQFEIAVPVAMQRAAEGGWRRGLGDIAVALKRVLAHSVNRRSILSVTGEVVLPTGKETDGLGEGTTIFEPFVAFGQLLRANGFLQAQLGAGLPTDRALPDEIFWRAVIGRTFEQGRFGRAWSPMIELLGARELESNARAQWAVLPQIQITLSKRQHVRINAGIRVPLTQRRERSTQVITYLLWDWFDGGLLDGWR
jgi:hypothetical protein